MKRIPIQVIEARSIGSGKGLVCLIISSQVRNERIPTRCGFRLAKREASVKLSQRWRSGQVDCLKPGELRLDPFLILVADTELSVPRQCGQRLLIVKVWTPRATGHSDVHCKSKPPRVCLDHSARLERFRFPKDSGADCSKRWRFLPSVTFHCARFFQSFHISHPRLGDAFSNLCDDWIIWTWVLTIGAVSCFGDEASSSEPPPQGLELLQLSLEDLGKIKVTSVSRKSENLSDASAAIYVITGEDIRHSGATTLAEALRMAPGLDVARASSRQWAISSRGFNNTFANKLLVLMDGRTIYTPFFSGVFWEETDTVLEDVDRIEVIRGPGATLWGANAVNGVINIITKSAKDTQGTLITGGGGIEERGFGSIRYGGKLASNILYRVYTKYSDRDAFTMPDGSSAHDNWRLSQSGFHMDWEPSEINRLTLQSDYFYGKVGGDIYVHSLNPPSLFPKAFYSKTEGGNLLGRWTHEFSSESDMSIQMYYDRTDREFGIGRELRDTFDVDAQHRFHIGDHQEIVWGAGYRYSADDIAETPDFLMREPHKGLNLFSTFAQDSITIVPGHLQFTLGTKIEHNDFTGLELQPSGRISWTPQERHTLWAAISRAVRTPSRSERGFSVFANPAPLLPALPLPLLAPGSGSPDYGAEDLLAYELGYRVKLHPRLSLDWTAFYNDYTHLQSVDAQPLELRISPEPSSTPYLLFPLIFANNLRGRTYGTEISATWQPVDTWRMRANYSYLRMALHTLGPVASFTEETEGISPQQQFSLSSELDLGRHVEWNFGLRYVDELPSALQRVPSYFELETRLAWKPTRNIELAIIGNNLLHAHHREFSPIIITARDVEIDRAIFGKLTLRF